MMLSTTRNFDQFGFDSHRWCCKCHWRHSRTLPPAAASLVVVGFFSSAMIVVGSINLLGVCYAENCHRLSSFLNESILVLLGILMVSNALTSLLILTSLVAAFFFMAEGLFRTVVAINNREMPGWGWYLGNVICSILFSIAVVVALPSSEAVTLGILLGRYWLTFGLQCLLD